MERKRQKVTCKWLKRWLSIAERWPHGATIPRLANGDELGAVFMGIGRKLVARQDQIGRKLVARQDQQNSVES